jgi:hypothetical protein
MRRLLALLLLCACSDGAKHVGPPWLEDARIFVQGYGVANQMCQQAICQHNENTDLVVWKGDTWLVHRTAKSQILGDDCALHIYQSKDHGAHFSETAVILPLTGRDLRDPHFYTIGDDLYIKALTRLPVTSSRDSNVETMAYGWHSSDGASWTQLPDPLAPTEWSLWRPKLKDGVWYSAAYHDGDSSVQLYTSSDGATWSAGAEVYTVSDDTPLETELTFMPSGALLALVRMDGTTDELLGTDTAALRTKVCWAQPPYDSFSCPDEIDMQRLDGPLAFFWQQRLFVVARKHLGEDGRKRTSLFELTGDFTGAGKLAIQEWGELPSAGDTSYAGAAVVDDNRVLLSWYSGDLVLDQTWTIGLFDASDIWLGTVNFSQLH